MIIYLIAGIFIYFVFRKFLDKFEIGGYGNRYVFITGCDTGFGHMLAVRLDDMGFRVFAGCLTKSGMESLHKVCSKRLEVVDIDVTQDTSIEKCLEEVKKKLPANRGLWAVVNNAGRSGGIGPTTWLTRKDYEDTLAVNLYGQIFVTQAFLPLVKAEKGRVVNMASILGRFPVFDGAYCVSKFGVEAFSDVLRQELYSTGTTVHLIEPGFFRTPMADAGPRRKCVREKLASLPPRLKEPLPPNMEEIIMDKFVQVTSQTSPDTYKVIDAYVHAITAKYPKSRYMVGTDANVVFRILMHLPEWLSDYIVKLMQP